MKIALITHGTRGDTQPFVAVALELMERGHDVTLAVPPNLQSFVEKCGVTVEKVAIDSQAFMESDEGCKWLAAGNVSEFMKRMSAIGHTHRDELIEDFLRVCGSADMIVASVADRRLHLGCRREEEYPAFVAAPGAAEDNGRLPEPPRHHPVIAFSNAEPGDARPVRTSMVEKTSRRRECVPPAARPEASQPIDGAPAYRARRLHDPCVQPSTCAAAV